MVQLEEKDLIGAGVARWCYAHPTDPALCIKIRRRKRRGRKQQRRELETLKRLQARGADLTGISAFRGITRTTLGKGYLYDMIRDQDGEPSRSLRHYFETRPEWRPRLVDLLRELRDSLFQERVLFYDLHDGNIQCRIGPEDRIDLIVIDGVGDRARLPFLNCFPSVLEKKLRRNWDQSVVKMLRHHPWLADFGEL